MIELNFSNMMTEVIGGRGISERELEGMREKVLRAHGEITERKFTEMGFLDLPSTDTSEVKNIAASIRDDTEYFVLLGIGGSALGPKTILEALSPFHNLRKTPKVFIYDNVDPSTLKSIASLIDLNKTTVNVVTKSGSTAETVASFMILYKQMEEALGDMAARRFIVTTDPEKGNLRKIAREKGMKSLPVPPDVGGRYSVLSPVGLLLAEVIGVDSDELLRGAGDIHKRCLEPDIWKNPAYIFGSLLYIMERERKRGIDVLLPYSDRLRPFSEWFCQLWAESLGKLGMGLTPYPSVGTTDQHSQLQLWMEGPEDKVVIFVRVEDHGADVRIPEVFAGMEGMGYLGGRTLRELMNAEEESTELCLAKAGRPNMTINQPEVDAYHLGQMFHFFEISTAFTGFLYGVNPFNQPSVEEGKNFTYAMMGRRGFEAKRKEVEAARQKKVCFRL